MEFFTGEGIYRGNKRESPYENSEVSMDYFTIPDNSFSISSLLCFHQLMLAKCVASAHTIAPFAIQATGLIRYKVPRVAAIANDVSNGLASHIHSITLPHALTDSQIPNVTFWVRTEKICFSS